MLTVGIDMAANPARTASCDIRWSDGAAVVEAVESPLDDHGVLTALTRASSAGVDCPFGWPDPFVDAVTAHRDASSWPDPTGGRDRLRLRVTDLYVRDDCKARNCRHGSRDERNVRVTPLSASTDRLGGMVLRWAKLMSSHEAEAGPIDRTSGGVVVEVYPAAALHRWELLRSGSRNPDLTVSTPVRAWMLDAVTSAIPRLAFADGVHAQLLGSDHALDAFVAALVARAATLPEGVDRPSTAEQHQHARTEGWILLPRCGLDDLVSSRMEHS